MVHGESCMIDMNQNMHLEDPYEFDDPIWFTMRVHHGGEFRYHPTIDYLNGHLQLVTRCDPDKVGLIFIDYIRGRLGYKEYASYYWLRPGHNMDTGLVFLATDNDIFNMCSTIGSTGRYVDIYFKHLNGPELVSEDVYKEDNTVVLSDGSEFSGSAYECDVNVEQVNDDDWEVCQTMLPGAPISESEETDGEDSNFEAEIDGIHNENESVNGENNDDADDEADNAECNNTIPMITVAETKSKKRKQKKTELRNVTKPQKEDWEVDSEYAESGDEDFNSLEEDSDDEGYKSSFKYPKYKRFNPLTEMKDPKLELGLVFTDNKEFKDAVRNYALKRGKKLEWVKNRKLVVSAKCKKGCPFYVYASQLPNTDNTFRIRTLVDKHKCGKTHKHRIVNSTWIAKQFVDKFRIEPNWPSELFFHEIRTVTKVSVPRSVQYRALQKAKELARGSLIDQYSALWDYKEELMKSNPGTTCEIKTVTQNDIEIFQRIYMCYGGCKKGFLAGCRKIIGLDGCFLKGVVKGMMLSAVGVDANNGMWPLAFAVVEGENKDSWEWFLEFLLVDIGCVNSFHWTFMSDKQKGLVPALERLVPNAEIRHCVKHLHDNFKLQFRGNALKKQFYCCAKACRPEGFDFQMKKLKEEFDEKAYEWLAAKPPSQWSRAYFRESTCCDMLLNNHCETFNSTILKGRSKPILDLLEWMRLYLMKRLQKCRENIKDWPELVCPRISQKMDKYKDQSQNFISTWSIDERYQVRGMYGDNYDVDLFTQRCSCRKWQLSGLPCPHAIAVMNDMSLEVDAYVADWYRKTTYLKSYEHAIYPITDRQQWPVTNKPAIHPPRDKKQPGRPRKKRVKSAGEKDDQPTKMKRYQKTVTCRICHHPGHNSRTCREKLIPEPAAIETNNVAQMDETNSVAQMEETNNVAQTSQQGKKQSKRVEKQPGSSKDAKTSQQGKKQSYTREKLPVKKSNIPSKESDDHQHNDARQVPTADKQPIQANQRGASTAMKKRISLSQDSSTIPINQANQQRSGPFSHDSSMMRLQPGQRMTMPQLPPVATRIGSTTINAESYTYGGKRCVGLASLQDAAARIKKGTGGTQ